MKMCTQCHRAGPKLGTCGSFMLCPGHGPNEQGHIDPNHQNFPEVDPAKDVVIECNACGQTVALPLFDILTGQSRVDFKCMRSKEHCEAVIVIPADHSPIYPDAKPAPKVIGKARTAPPKA